MVINISITNKRPVVHGTPTIVCGNSDYSIDFTFDEEWNAHAIKTARFVFRSGSSVEYNDVVFGGNTATVPILSGINEVFVGVYAGELHTTTPARIPCDRSILCGTSTEHDEPDPDVYNQILEAVNQLIGSVGNHPTRTDNPHGVTAEQVGARPNTWMPSASDVKAAPAGYGLGELSTARHVTTLEELDALTVNTWFIYGSENNPLLVPSSQTEITYAYGRVDTFDGTHATQTIVPVIPWYGSTLVRHRRNGVWGEIEWDNPPMEPNVEYRTTKRHNGEAVYTKMIELSPSEFTERTKYFNHGISNLDIGISVNVLWLMNGTQWRTFPSSYYDNVEWSGQAYWNGESYIVFEIGYSLVTHMSASERDIQVTLEYTKTP